VSEPAAGIGRWQLRPVAKDRAATYLESGWWTDASLGETVAAGLGRVPGERLVVHSAVHPWEGTFADIDRGARAFARWLQDRGVGAEDVVVFQLPNWMEAAIAFWGSAYVGAAVVPVVHFYGAKELDYILSVTTPAAVITADTFGRSDFLAMYDDLLPRHGSPPWLVVDSASGGVLPRDAISFAAAIDGDPIAAPVTVDPDGPAIIAFTSGTTSNPKGVVHSHRTIGCEARQLNSMFPDIGPPPITGAPVGHFIGMVNAFLVPLLRTTAVNLVDVWDPGRILKLMLDEQLAMAGGATYFLTSLLDHPDFTDEHLRLMPFAGLGGSTVPAAVTARAERMGIRAYRSYGSTEHPSITGSLLDEPQIKRNTTDGHVLAGVEIRLTADGEIESRGPDCFLGYTDAELTASVFDADGWYRTGDVGVIDDDGYLTITDRISDVIIRGGENISATEVEDLLLGLDAVAEVSVIGVPDDRLGERAAALVRLRDGMTAPTLDEMRRHLDGVGLARQKWPESVEVVKDFPRTPSGKIQKFRLRDARRQRPESG
jgi:acyl-CoA synthetase (AMP-forming)/AMP-acid ligase II